MTKATGRVSGKVAIVTGGASGLGAAIATMLVREGAEVVITDIQDDAGKALAEKLGCTFLHQDVAEEARWPEVIAAVKTQFGGLHILINNAGFEGPLDAVSPENTRLADWQRIHRVNVEGVFLGCRAAIPVMRESGGGSIVNMSSIGALVATPFLSAYGASKAAVRQFTTSVALHCAETGSRIRCNSVHPGQIRTPMLDKLFRDTGERHGITTAEAETAFLGRIPLKEFGEPDDIAYAVLFLASDESKHVTGAQIVVDGGMDIV
ncbi:glucose 1-dehydrogenase [Govanella unica]|uniref:Glucose 1-dehydrogenase n=1 Tax=Govanella unica TaxID=2975056 RepID=A0A9X3TUS2_9PROT|nr:glucose 1-dehydrogenase [Govania unica]MDA5192531.1 glucose 1-dehydrogenase [Govania unica]